MKMGKAKVCGCLAMSVLLFILLVDPTQAQNAAIIAEMKDTFCGENIVMTGIYLDLWNKAGVYHDEEEGIVIRPFRTIQVFKSPIDLNGVIEINTSDFEDCGYSSTEVNTKFLVLANWMDGEIVCAWNRPWNDLRWFEKRAIDRIADEGCN